MRKFLYLFFILTLVMGFISADWIALQRDAKGKAPQICVLVCDENHAVVEVTLPGFFCDQARDELKRLHIPGSVPCESVGKSALPVISGLLQIPSNTTSVKIADYRVLSTKEYQGIRAYPFQTPTTDDKPKAAFVQNQAHYRSGEIYPVNCLTLEKPANWRNRRIVSFRLTPMQVKPAAGLLKVHGKVQFTLRFEKGRNDFLATSSSRIFEKMQQNLIINYRAERVDSADAKKYLVIAKDSLVEAIKPLVDYRAAQGFKVEVAKLSEVGTTPQNIKDYIVAAYKKGLDYVLLVGDPADLPIYKWGDNPSDYWYACANGSDMYADVAIGRICAVNAGEVKVYIEKIMAYEAYDSNGDDWAVKALLTSHLEYAPGKYHGCVEETRKEQYKYKLNFKVRHGYDGNTNAQILAEIEEGCGIVAYRGHGSTTAWTGWNKLGEYLNTTQVKKLNNDKYPVIFSIACSNAQLDSSTTTLAETYLKHSFGGACAFLGATRPSYTTPNHNFYKYLFVSAFNEGIVNIGNVSNAANAKLLKQYGESSYATTNVKMYLWLGDPAMRLHIVK